MDNWRFAQCFGDKVGNKYSNVYLNLYLIGWRWRSHRRFVTSRLVDDILRLNLADIISTVEFDQTGDYLATGDKGGRVVLFERNQTVGFMYSD